MCSVGSKQGVSKLPLTEDIRIATTSKRNKLLTAPEITSSMKSFREDPISVTTVKR